MKQFIFEYKWNGSTYATIIHARDDVEAIFRAQAMERGLTYKGESVLKVKVAPNWVGRLLEWWRGK